MSCVDADSLFYDKSNKLFKDEKYSTAKEIRFLIYGKRIENRWLMVEFTIRKGCVRIIIARQAPKKEREIYEN